MSSAGDPGARRAGGTRGLALALACCLLSAPGLLGCRASAQGARLPAGPGLVSSDTEPPAGTPVHAVPSWREGDRFVYRKADRARIPLRVVRAEDGALELLDEDSGRRLFVGPDQLERGQTGPDGEPGYELDPGDALVSWPLWEGKRWASQFVSRAEGRGDLPLVALYECDGSETVTVPAGTFECLRIWRRVRLAAAGDFPERVALLWYAPEAGVFVRRLDDGLVSELEELQRQR